MFQQVGGETYEIPRVKCGDLRDQIEGVRVEVSVRVGNNIV